MPPVFQAEGPKGIKEKQKPASLSDNSDKISPFANTEENKSSSSFWSIIEFQKYARFYDSGHRSLHQTQEHPDRSTMPKLSNVSARDGNPKSPPASAGASTLLQRNLGVAYKSLFGIGITEQIRLEDGSELKEEFGTSQMRENNAEGPQTPPKYSVIANEFGNYTSTPDRGHFDLSASHSSSTTDSSECIPWRAKSQISHIKQRESISSLSTASSKALSNASPQKSTADPTRKKEILQMKSWRNTSIRTAVSTPDDATVERARQAFAAIVPAHIQGIAAEIQAKQAVIERQNGPGIVRSFRPSFSALQRFGLLPDLDAVRSAISASQYGGAEKYLGDMRIEHNRSANIPVDQNCALWVLGLPANVSYTSLLRSIRQVGKVYATVINPPTGLHTTSAAKIIFFKRSEAEILFNMIASGRFRVMGRPVVDVRWNNIKTGSYPLIEQSRAIRITGPDRWMNFDFFEVFFKTRFTYELDQKLVVPCHTVGSAAHEWHFSSVRCQATSAKVAIEREYPGIFAVEWARDPCEST